MTSLWLWQNKVVGKYLKAKEDVDAFIRKEIVRETDRVIWKQGTYKGRMARVDRVSWKIEGEKLDVQVLVRTFRLDGGLLVAEEHGNLYREFYFYFKRVD